MIVLDLLRDIGATIIARLRPLPTRSGQVAAKRRRIEIPLLIRQWIMLAEPAQVHVVSVLLTGGDEAGDQLVVFRVVVRRRFDGQTVVGCAEAETKTIRHHARARITRFAGLAFADQRQQPAGWLAFDDVWIERKVPIPDALTARHAPVRRPASGD